MDHLWRNWIKGIMRPGYAPALAISLVGLMLRLTNLTSELVEVHSWRQADTAMIARNFFRHGFNILYPQIDWAGPLPGYVGTEFPLVPYLAALLYSLFGEHFNLGRLISISFFIPTMAFVYLLVQRFFGHRAALLALFFFTFSPLSIYYSRTFMSESAMLFFSTGALLFFERWGETDAVPMYILALFFATFALLVKITTVIIALPIGYLAWQKYGWGVFRQGALWMFAFLVSLPSALWYRHAIRLARANYPFHMFGEGGWIWDEGVDVFRQLGLLKAILLNIGVSTITPIGFAFAVAGAVLIWRRLQGTYLFHWWMAGFLILLVLALPGYRHEYYHLPLVPVISGFAGVFCAHIMTRPLDRIAFPWRRKLRLGIVMALVIVLLMSYVMTNLRYHSEITSLLYRAGKVANRELPHDTLIAAADWKNPVLIYASSRRGWHFPEGEKFLESGLLWAPQRLERLRQEGAQYFIAPVRPDPSRQKDSLLRLLVRRIDGPREFDFLDSHPEFKSYLENRYAKVFENTVVVIYDLRSSKEK